MLDSYDGNLAVVVHSDVEVLETVKRIMKTGRAKDKGFIYIYYDMLKYDSIKSENVEEECIVF